MNKTLRLVFKSYMAVSVFMLLTGLGIFILFLLYKTIGAFITNINFIKMDEELPAIIGTLAVTFLSVGFAAPVGVLTGIFINEYTHGKIKNILIFIFTSRCCFIEY